MSNRISGTIMEPGQHVVGAGRSDGRRWLFEWDRRERKRARITITPDDGALLTDAQLKTAKRLVVSLEKSA